MEKTFLMVKPDGVARGLIGEIISRFENKGYTLNRLEMMTPSKETAEAHYAEHNEKPFF
ncbi:nucleoside-diphosphate kinase, partial [Exiguobacterium profundum]|uniref:nucleoside-diphosphate kinase n=1 Tax=Exiguobacterium profundum TaxID=307643 RepID=UPI00391BA70C